MLETEDIDDDYFTPASSTSLASIFGKSRKDDGTENESLKYTPPKPTKPEEPKSSQCIYACALLGYEWCNGAYIPKGKLGFALIKIIKTGIHNIVLYDSNKITLSCVTISTGLEVTVKENVYLSYHDNLKKYWSLTATEDETNKIVELLKSLNVNVKFVSDEHKGLPETQITETDSVMKEKEVKDEKESDTDSSINRRTKISILNRMASMGQSVLPPRTVSTEKTSDSSDTNDTNHYKTVRHKPVKSSMKRNSSDKNLPECQSLVEAEKIGSSIIEHSNHSVPLFSYINGQLVPVTKTNLITSPSNTSGTSGTDTSLYISEQRVSNSEIRINMNRMTDKVDQILGKLSNLENRDKTEVTGNFQMDVLQKLLGEYENKIKMYESFIRSQKLDQQLFGLVSQVTPSKANSENKEKTDQVQILEQISKEKDKKIADLESKIKELHDKFDDALIKEKKSTEELLKEMEFLKQELDIKNKELSISVKHCEEMSQRDEDGEIGNKIKNLMNDTFRAISSNFENDREYCGERVKAVTATVIKKVTIESLNNL